MMRSRIPLFRSAICVTGALLGVAVISGAQDTEKNMPPVAKEVARPMASKQTLLKLLAEPIETKSFDAAGPMMFKEFLGLVQHRMEMKGMELPILVDFEAFKEETPDAFKEEADLYDEVKVKIPLQPRRLALGTLLRIAISKIPTNNAALVVRKGMVEVTTVSRAAPCALMETGVNAVFDRRGLMSAIEELAEMTGATIVVDQRIGNKGDTLVTANFVNGVPLKTALGLLADMTSLKIVEMEGALYLTTAENAEALRKERKSRQEEELWRNSKGIPEANPPAPRRGEAGVWLMPPWETESAVQKRLVLL